MPKKNSKFTTNWCRNPRNKPSANGAKFSNSASSGELPLPIHISESGQVGQALSPANPILALKRQFESELNHPRIVHRVINHGKRGRIEVRTGPDTAGRTELRMVEQVEELRPKIQPHSFPRNKVLNDREVRVHETRTRKRRPVRVPQLPGCGL